jgi:nicotinamidase-related amidase
MTTHSPLLSPDQPAVLLVDPQPGLAFAVQSIDRQALTNNLQALAKIAKAFALPLIVSTSATKVYSGPVMTALRNVLPPDTPVFDRKSMNVWEDASAREAVLKTGRKRLVIAGLLTEACVSFPALDALAEGYEVFVVADACGGATTVSHDLALERLRDRGAQLTSWLQLLLELQRDWTRQSSYTAARDIVESHGGGYGIGLAYARDMLTPSSPRPSTGA